MNELKYETINMGYINKEQAIAIANCDRCLKESIYQSWKKNNIYPGRILFRKFSIALVKIDEDYAWHIKVIEGEYGATKVKRIPILKIKYGHENFEGFFTEESNISCVVMCNTGHYHYDYDTTSFKEPDLDDYEEYIHQNSIYVTVN